MVSLVALWLALWRKGLAVQDRLMARLGLGVPVIAAKTAGGAALDASESKPATQSSTAVGPAELNRATRSSATE